MKPLLDVRADRWSHRAPLPQAQWPSDPEWRKPEADARRIQAGDVIPGGHYADQPYIVKTGDGAWLCVVTTGSGDEGSRGQHVISLRSLDQGKTWSDRVPLESPEGPESSWGVPFVAPGGRIFVFYVYNADDLRELPADDPPYPGGKTGRMDSHGYYVFRWSDDHGRSWSSKRATIPVREFHIDRNNSVGGGVRLFWNVGRPLALGGSLLLPLHKVGGFGSGWFTRSEGAFVRSDDLLAANDPAGAHWETLPDGEHGLRTPPGGGLIAEEQSIVILSDGSLFVVYRSTDGHPVGAYSRDRGRTWSVPQYLAYAEGGLLKHPRAACFVWKLGEGYVLWFHNHGGKFVGQHPERATLGYSDRNPAWMCRGREITTSRGPEIAWEAPEIALYDDDPCVRMSYPDLIEDGGAVFVTETQKAVARVHRLAPAVEKALRLGPGGFDPDALRTEAALDWGPGRAAVLPPLPRFLGRSGESPYGMSDLRAGFSVELVFDAALAEAGAVLAGGWDPAFGGLRLRWLAGERVGLEASDGRTEISWRSDEALPGGPDRRHVVAVVDGGPKVAWFLYGGRFGDGGQERPFGWGRFSPHFRGLAAGIPLRVASAVQALRIYPRALLAAEGVALARRAKGE